MTEQLETVAASLYDGGWRSEDLKEIVEEYGLTVEYAEKLTEVLKIITEIKADLNIINKRIGAK